MFLLTSMYVLHHKNVWVIISCSLMHAFAIHLHACMFCMWHSSSDASDLNQSIVEKQFVQAEGLTFLLRFGVSLILHCLWRSCLLGCMHVWVKVTVEQFSQNLKGTDLSAWSLLSELSRKPNFFYSSHTDVFELPKTEVANLNILQLATI